MTNVAFAEQWQPPPFRSAEAVMAKKTTRTVQGAARTATKAEELSDEQLEGVSGGAEALRLLASVAHHQAESAAADLEAIADAQESALSSRKKPR